MIRPPYRTSRFPWDFDHEWTARGALAVKGIAVFDGGKTVGIEFGFAKFSAAVTGD